MIKYFCTEYQDRLRQQTVQSVTVDRTVHYRRLYNPLQQIIKAHRKKALSLQEEMT